MVLSVSDPERTLYYNRESNLATAGGLSLPCFEGATYDKE